MTIDLRQERVSRLSAGRSRALTALPTSAFVVDVVTILVSIGAAVVLRRFWSAFAMGANVSDSLIVAGPSIVATWLVCIALRGGYTRSVFEAGTDEYRRVAAASLYAAGLVGVGCYFFSFSLSRGFFVLAFVVGIPALIAGRVALRSLVHQAREHGGLLHRVIIAGTPGSIDEVAAVLRRERRLGYEVLGAVCAPGTTAETTPSLIPILATTDQVTRAVVESRADVLFLAEGSLTSSAQMRSIVWELEPHRVQVVVAPSISDVAGDRVRMRPVGGLPLIHVDPPRAVDAARWGKRAFDIVGASLALLAALPVLAFAAIQVKRHDGGPVLFRQTRAGRDGARFDCLKLRTMTVDAEAMLAQLHDSAGFEGGLFKMADDPRITAPGRWLRRFSIDEIPQLWNVVRGDMSLVGPRPPLLSEVERYESHHARRLHVRPGITGLWQVSGRSDLSFDEAIRLDLYYVDNWSPLQDLSIMVKTVGAILGSRGAY